MLLQSVITQWLLTQVHIHNNNKVHRKYPCVRSHKKDMRVKAMTCFNAFTTHSVVIESK